jgi:MoxR-like ATPase
MVDLGKSAHTASFSEVGAWITGTVLTRAWAAIQGRSYVVPDDIKKFIQPALSHRIILEPSLWDIKKSENTVIAEVIQSVSVPVLKPENE